MSLCGVGINRKTYRGSGMFCMQCGTQVVEASARFCGRCGTSLSVPEGRDAPSPETGRAPAQPPGFYADPFDSTTLRWWLGKAWQEKNTDTARQRAALTSAVPPLGRPVAVPVTGLAGYYTDPADPSRHRYWSGAGWAATPRSSASHDATVKPGLASRPEEESPDGLADPGALSPRARSVISKVPWVMGAAVIAVLALWVVPAWPTITDWVKQATSGTSAAPRDVTNSVACVDASAVAANAVIAELSTVANAALGGQVITTDDVRDQAHKLALERTPSGTLNTALATLSASVLDLMDASDAAAGSLAGFNVGQLGGDGSRLPSEQDPALEAAERVFLGLRNSEDAMNVAANVVYMLCPPGTVPTPSN